MPSTPTLTPQAFVAKWRAVALTERSSYQQHFIDLCHLVSHPTPAEADPTGASFTFEAGVTKQSGKQGWADVWKRGCFALEYKGKHANLDRAYQQILQYREALENPPLLVVSDMTQLVIHTNFTNTVKQITTLTFDDLLTPQGMQRLRALFYAPEAFRAPHTTEQVTKEAAEQFARLADQLRKWGEDPHQIAHFLIRLLFCLFAEDIGLLPPRLFSQLIAATRTRPAAFAQQLRLLFDAMATGGWFGADEILHFNGRLFDDAPVLELDSDGLEMLQRVSALDWSSIEPAIFGTLFERSLDPSKRAQLGAHYTSRDDILLIIEPVLMAPLRQRWDAVQTDARDRAARRDAATNASQRSRLQHEVSALLRGFAEQIAAVRVLDPACGSGNFLYVALKQLLDLEKEVITFAGDVGAGTFFPMVGPEQLRGIEINEYAHELASTTVWIGYIQWLRDNGFGAPSAPILKALDTIVQMDALLAVDAEGKPYEPAWPEADVIVGNPPFVGGNKVRQELGGTYVDALFALYQGRIPGGADFVTYWFERAQALIAAGAVQRAGLLATNSIRGGANRRVLERIKESGGIFMAWSDRPWVLDGANVRVSMIGFDKGAEQSRMLNNKAVTAINTDLTAALDLTGAVQLMENAGINVRADEKGGAFDISSATAQQLTRAPLNINGKPNTDVVRRWATATDVTKRKRDMWIIDFGVDMSVEEAAEYEMPFKHVEQHVKPERATNNIPRLRREWWRHRVSGAPMRAALSKLTRYIATPVTAKYRLFVWLESTVLPDITLAVFAREDDYFFGVLHSRPHELWSLRKGGWMGVGNDPRYTPTTTFETFPFPWPPGSEPADDPRVAAIGAAARALVEKRDRWLNPEGASADELKKRTLTNLYNQRPAWLDLAHRALDRAVCAAYGWPDDLADEAMLEQLLALNGARVGG